MAPLYTRRPHSSRAHHSHRNVSSTHQPPHTSSCELDSHADTCAFGQHAAILQRTGMTTGVDGFTSSLGSLEQIEIVTAAVAFDCDATLRTYLLCFPQSLYIPELENNLLSTFQLRSFGVTVNDIPLQFIDADKRQPTDHSILVDNLTIPLSIAGVTSYFDTRLPTQDELQHPHLCERVYLTAGHWNPHDRAPADTETRLRNHFEFGDAYRPYREARMLSSIETALCSVSPTLLPSHFYSLACRTDRIASLQSFPKRKGFVSPQQLSNRWHIGIEAATRTIEQTTQLAVRDFTHTTGGRRLKPTSYQLKHRRLNVAMYTDTVYFGTKSIRQFTCAQLFCTDFQWAGFYPLREARDAHMSLDSLFQNVGVPSTMIPDNARNLTHGEFAKQCRRAHCLIKPVEAYFPNLNIAEHIIREFRRDMLRIFRATNAPAIFWCYLGQYVSYVRSHTAHNIQLLQGETPQARLLGDTPDISFISEFAWFDWVWYITPPMKDDSFRSLGRYLGPSSDIGEAMAAYVLNSNGYVHTRTSVYPLKAHEVHDAAVKEQQAKFMADLKEKLGDRMAGMQMIDDAEAKEDPDTSVLYDDDEEEDEIKPIGDTDAFEEEHGYDKYISAKVLLPDGDSLSRGTVKRRKRDASGNFIGRSNPNPILDTSLYEVEFDDGRVEAYHANLIAESIYEQVDEDGFNIRTLDEIIDHHADETAIKVEDGTYKFNGKDYKKRTTRGWKLCCTWKDGTTSWEWLRDLKDSYPIQVAEYATNNLLATEPAFAWWVPYTIKKRSRIIKAMGKRYFRTEQKFGIELPKTVKRAYEIDDETGTTYWRDAIKKELKAVCPAFEFIEDETKNLVGYSEISGHIVFDVKMDFTRKARFCANPHGKGKAEEIKSAPINTYASVVSRESIRIIFMLAALNDLNVLAADVGNAYLNAPAREKVWFRAGPEFAEKEGQRVVVRMALYGLFGSGAAWRRTLAETLRDSLGFTSCRADPDVWFRPATKQDGTKYYEYVVVYTDDILALSTDPRSILTQIDQHYMLKKQSIGEPDRYLGATISKNHLDDDPSKVRWGMGADQYVKEAIRNVENWLEQRDRTLKNNVTTTLPNNYTPELDASEYCSDEETNYYMQQIGVLRWAVELGRIDNCHDVSVMAAFSAAPRRGHLDAVFHLFSYLKKHDRSRIVFDDSYIPFDDSQQQQLDWSDFYDVVPEEMPPDMPEPRGFSVQTTAFVDASFAQDKVTRRSRTGVLVYVNRSIVNYLSKKQTSIETSTFGAEFMALKIGVEMVIGLRYKLRMMGVPLDGPSRIRCDNQSVVYNASLPKSQLKKKSNSIAYNFVRECCARKIIYVGYETTNTNLADILTKTLPGPKRVELCRKLGLF